MSDDEGQFIYTSSGVYFTLDGVLMSHLNEEDPGEILFGYMRRIMEAIDGYEPMAGSVLHLGGGAMTLPRYINHKYPNAQNWVVEHSDKIVAHVKRVFPLPPNVTVLIGDAVKFIHNPQDREWDIIVVDCMDNRWRTPEGLVSTDGIEMMKDMLAPEGVLAINMVTNNLGGSGAFLEANRNLAREFKFRVRSADANAADGRAGNVVLIASNSTKRFDQIALAKKANRDGWYSRPSEYEL